MSKGSAPEPSLSCPHQAGHATVRKLAFVTLIYFAQGVVPGLSLTALLDFLNADGVPLQRTAAMFGYIGIPWTLSFVWGPIIDTVRIPRFARRQGWLLASSVAALITLLPMHMIRDPAMSLGSLTALFVLHSVFASVIDASTDALVVEMIDEAEIPKAHAWGRGGLICGTAVSTFVTAWTLTAMPFAVTAAFVATTWAVCFAIALWLYRPAWESRQAVLTRAVATVPATGEAANGQTSKDQTSNDPATNGQWAKESDPRDYFRVLVRQLFSPRSVVTAISVASMFAIYAIMKLVVNFHVIEQNETVATMFTTARGAVNFVCSVVMIAVAQFAFPRMGIWKQSLLTGVCVVVFIVACAALLSMPTQPRWGIGIYLVSLSLTRLLLYLTACRHFALLSVPLTAGAQFTAYMALLNVAEVGSALVLARFSTGG